MKAGKYSIKELFNNRYIEQIVIPEIQRDYVWGKKEVEGLLNSIHEDFEVFRSGIEINKEIIADIEIKKAFEQFYKKQKFSCNIGFIYAYNDPEYSGKYFLIDGQQRLTTIYLLLLVLASENSDFREKFNKLYTFSGLPIIDYRVREASHYLLRDVVAHYKNRGIDIANQSWYYDDYKSDKTIKSVTANIYIIENFVIQKNLANNEFINYVQDYIEFWYFDTNISEQGEDLYIYMNARGEQMQENENLKADLLGKLKQPTNNTQSLSELKNEWGEKWEEWQQFFWRNRKDNPNADKGFNEFICCIAGLENYLNSKQVVYSKDDFDKDTRGKKDQVAYSDIFDQFNNNGLEKISEYVNGLAYLFNKENIQQFKNYYTNITWIEKCLNEILLIFNSNSTNWFADINDSNRGIEHSRMVFIWSLLHYMTTRNNTPENDTIYRALRLYYIRFNNYNRSVKNISLDVESINSNGILNITGTDEENEKNLFYTKIIQSNEIRNFEELIWEIEDHPLNIDGRDAKAINCSHLVNFNAHPNLEEIRLIKEKFYQLFPVEKDEKINEANYKKLINVLLFYGEFWERKSPWYCYNYCFSNWKKIIRNIDTKNNPFKTFFDNYKCKSFEEIYKEMVIDFEIDFELSNFHEQLKWFAVKLDKKLWNQGFYIVYDHYNYPKKDLNFINSREILNTKGDFKGGNPQVLSKLIML